MGDYPFVQAAYDFGLRKGPTLALVIHGAEAEAGVVGYLSRKPARNVSANFVCERSGRMVRMLDYSHASGAMNPADRSTDKAYYGRRHLVAVLGDWWRDPNAAVISVEGEWYAKTGPTPAQEKGLVAWAKDMKQRYPGIRGALGHADQTDTKGCPGSTAAVRRIFRDIGGHGLFSEGEAEMPLVNYTAASTEVGGHITVKASGATAITLDGAERLPIAAGTRRPALGMVTLTDLDKPKGRACYLIFVGSEIAFISAASVQFAPSTVTDGEALATRDAEWREWLTAGSPGDDQKS